jgi:hypothetical protein
VSNIKKTLLRLFWPSDMAFKQPLTRADLQAIIERNSSPDVKDLLWEVTRLRSIVLRADQLKASLGNPGGGVGLILGALRTELEGEPCVVEQVRLDLGRPAPRGEP